MSMPPSALGALPDSALPEPSNLRTVPIAETSTGQDDQDPPRSGPEAAPHKNNVLRSLAPAYKDEHHQTYVEHLDLAVADHRNKNIALTGRYGAGKSSILDEFIKGQRAQHRKTLRISINTLGVDAKTEGLTNRIQKELVKQLIYRPEPGKIRRSEFARQADLTPGLAFGQAFGLTVIIVGLLWIFGVRPDGNALGTGNALWSLVAFFSLVLGGTWAGRWFLGALFVSQFSTGGTSITLEKKTESYFDKFLDEIMAFFEATEPDIVVFEDLDRFEDPLIFDSLRELNTLINESAHWADREPIRFIYAIKDSVFEKIGQDSPASRNSPASSGADMEPSEEASADLDAGEGSSQDSAFVLSKNLEATQAAIERANRTKFFEIVVPIVPFLSHNNAADLLQDLLDDLQLQESASVSRGLIDLVARHTTDMRLLINIRNEFLVFAERLLWCENPAPGMTADKLFAIVVYKNFHPSDFEKLAHRGSDLDELARVHRKFISEGVKQLYEDKYNLHEVNKLQRQQRQTAELLSDRLQAASAMQQHRILSLELDGQSPQNPAVAKTPDFWKQLQRADTLTVNYEVRKPYGALEKSSNYLDRAKLDALFPEAARQGQWEKQKPEELVGERVEIDRTVARLRGAGFGELLKDHRLRVDQHSFEDHLTTILSSDLARDLVRRGYIEHYFAEYSASFYGEFRGVDVAKFFNVCIWPNEMDPQFAFTSSASVSNLLELAPADFTRSRSVLNIKIVNHLLEQSDKKLAREVVAFIVDEHTVDGERFLSSFFRDSESRLKELVELLAEHPWPYLFKYLMAEGTVLEEDVKSQLLDVALTSARDPEGFSIDRSVREEIVERYSDLSAFTKAQKFGPKVFIEEFVKEHRLKFNSIVDLSPSLKDTVVSERAYVLSAPNIRSALGFATVPTLNDGVSEGLLQSITLEAALKRPNVSNYCLDEIDAYFDIVEKDPDTPHGIDSPKMLLAVLDRYLEVWSVEGLQRALTLSSQNAAIPELASADPQGWSALVAKNRVTPTADNLFTYIEAEGVDEAVAQFLFPEPNGPCIGIQGVEDLNPSDLQTMITKVLNAGHVLEAGQRVKVVLELEPEFRLAPEVRTHVAATPGDALFRHLLKSQLVPDDLETFMHFQSIGWPALAEALAASTKAQDFLSPNLIGTHAAAVLGNEAIPTATRAVLLEDLASYIPIDDPGVLGEAARLAHAWKIQFTLADLRRIAPHGATTDVLWQLNLRKDELPSAEMLQLLSSHGGDFEGFSAENGRIFSVPASDTLSSLLKGAWAIRHVRVASGSNSSRTRIELL
ncbi:hypothetical protein [Pseudoclavibacter sp. VKM Ac-2867]|uniref:YobI family P-loop NTPase n=1 Tax=Pseudoclavibacter sp. VKM Ac-2867 TaxID=2783829 RepID=UPI00188B0006|nr:hypothetical protein [Pseudoclavibacter sp. VKM Ac-2867]MBF4459473.1 hypothetical protein [Pseudoclavibacter sp. VKM Ac-2867]